ncbi:MAG: hypothetical protein AAFY50_18520 [Cyanobacteria bacterium J06648_1]
MWGSCYVPIRRATHSLYRGKVPSGRWRGCAVRRKAQGNARDWGFLKDTPTDMGDSSPNMGLCI